MMRTPAAMVVLLLAAGGCASPRSVQGDATMQTSEVQHLLDAAYQAMGHQDLGALLEIYTDDAVIQSAGERAVVGKPAIERFWSATFERFEVKLTPTVDECSAVGEI